MKEQLKQNIEKMKAELAEMEAELEKSEKVELEKGSFELWANGHISNKEGYKDYANNGATRATKELAEIASKNMVARNKLEAYAMQLEPEWRDGGINTYAWRIWIDDEDKYEIDYDINIRILGTVYMSKQTAETLCQWLNEGRITLDKE